jgi:hypothetical protein
MVNGIQKIEKKLVLEHLHINLENFMKVKNIFIIYLSYICIYIYIFVVDFKIIIYLFYIKIGYFLNDQFHGEGQYNMKSGDRYVGNYEYNVRCGFGTYTYYDSGDIYTGNFLNGVYDGEGCYEYASDNATYEGSWTNGKKNGFGTYKYANGIILIIFIFFIISLNYNSSLKIISIQILFHCLT